MVSPETIFYVCLVKLCHIFILWACFYVAEKFALDAFVSRVYMAPASSPPPAPPSLLWEVLGVFVADGVLCALGLLLVAHMLGRARKLVLPLAALDFLGGWTLALGISIAVACATQHNREMRYGDDGVRGIRAFGITALALSAAAVTLPLFLVL